MPSSNVITSFLINQPNPLQSKEELWRKCRYLVAHDPVTDDFTETTTQYYNGRLVIPGPLSDPRLVAPLEDDDLNKLEAIHFIRFIDNETTAGAEAETVRANFGMMDDAEADDFEAQLRAKLKRNAASEAKSAA